VAELEEKTGFRSNLGSIFSEDMEREVEGKGRSNVRRRSNGWENAVGEQSHFAQEKVTLRPLLGAGGFTKS